MIQSHDPQVAPTDAAIAVLNQVAAYYTNQSRSRPPAKAVVQALVQLEKVAKKQSTTYESADILGKWRLRFVANQKSRRQAGTIQGRGFYVPKFVTAQIQFQPSETQSLASSASEQSAIAIGNQLRLGPLAFKVNGPARRDRKNLVAFDFTQMQLQLFGQSLYQGNMQNKARSDQPFAQQPIAKLPFFNFFYISDTLLAARGRGGGLAIWSRVT
ncbi:MAG: hypothetical protein ACTS2F_13090 [Thainema sp.]